MSTYFIVVCKVRVQNIQEIPPRIRSSLIRRSPIIDLNTLTIIGTTQAINESYTIVNPIIELWRMLNINEIK